MTRRLLLLFGLLALLPAAGLTHHHPPPARKATLVVRSTPSGAQVFVDGVARGLTPLTVRLKVGAHRVELVKEGHVTAERRVSLRAGKRKVLNVRLKTAKPLDPAEKERRRGAVAGVTPPLGQVGVLARMFFSSSGFGGGLPGAVSGEAVFDTVSGMYVVTSVEIDDDGNLVVTADYFLDEALTQPTGGFVIVADGATSTATYSFTAGDLTGHSGTMVVTAVDLTHFTVAAEGESPGGGSYTADLEATLSLTGFTLTGTVVLTAPGGAQTEWEANLTLEGGTFTGDVGGIHIVAHFNSDGSGSATLTDAATGVTLATIVWDADGTAVITYPDGSSETFEIF